MFKMDFVKESWQRKYQAVQNDEVPWTPLVKPIEESRIVLVTTGGVHLKSDTPFDMSDSNGDPSFRMIPSQAKPEELMITHDYTIIEMPIKTLTLSSPGRFSTDLSKKAFWDPLAIIFFPSWGISTDL